MTELERDILRGHLNANLFVGNKQIIQWAYNYDWLHYCLFSEADDPPPKGVPYCWVEKNDEFFLIDSIGLPCNKKRYDDLGSSVPGGIIAIRNGQMFLVNKKGEEAPYKIK